MNLKFSRQVIAELVQQGARDFCICPGARNAPLIETLGSATNCNVLSFFDERSASFFALGRARRDQRPVVVVTTSGTAVAEMLPAAIEAHYTDTPLVLLTADRPKRLRGTGAPQAIEQSQIFRNFVADAWDLSVGDSVEVNIHKKKPYHINLCFDEPLLDGKPEPWVVEGQDNHFTGHEYNPFESLPVFTKSLIVVGALQSSERENLKNVLPKLKVPLFLEAASGLRNTEALESQRLLGGEKMVSQMLRSGEIESVIRIGDVPLGRYWRDLDQMSITVHSFSNKAFAGTDKSLLTELDLSQWEGPQCEAWDWSSWRNKGEEKQETLLNLIADFPKSEVAFFKKFAQTLVHEESLYLGNSLPIRLWDLVGEHSRGFRSNRGANGIDGQLSTAFGWLTPKSKNRIVVGDLTALYDFNGLWVTPFLKTQNVDVEMIVVNNGGGQIFSRIFANDLFQNRHNHSFDSIAQFWGWDYSKVDDPECMRPATGLSLVEWTPDAKQTLNFWENYDRLWEK